MKLYKIILGIFVVIILVLAVCVVWFFMGAKNSGLDYGKNGIEVLIKITGTFVKGENIIGLAEECSNYFFLENNSSDQRIVLVPEVGHYNEWSEFTSNYGNKRVEISGRYAISYTPVEDKARELCQIDSYLVINSVKLLGEK